MAIDHILRGAGNGEGDIVKFVNGNTARMVYVVGDDGGPAQGGASVAFVPPAGGYTDTTGHTIAPAVAGKSNYLSSLTVSNGSATGSEWTVDNGAAGPVIARGYIGPNTTTTYAFNPQVFGSVNTLLEFKLATTGTATYVTPTGYAA